MTNEIKNRNRVHEPLFHITRISQENKISKNKAWIVRGIAILAALTVSALFAWIFFGVNPINVCMSIVRGSFGTTRKIWVMLKDIALLLGVALALTPAFKMRFWNIGGEGQVLAGGLATVACMFYLGGKISEGLLLVIMLVAGVAAGAIWGLIPAVFKAVWNTNETLFTLMMNYIIIQLVRYFIGVWVPGGSNVLGIMTYGELPKVMNEWLLVILIIGILTALMYVYLKYSKQGYEISVVGESERTARYAGINVKKVIIRTMIISGAICGLVGFLIVSAFDRSITVETAGGRGFTAIMVSWLGKFNPAFMALTSFLIVFLERGGSQMITDYNVSVAMPEIITAIILFFIIGCEFFLNYKIILNKKFIGKGKTEAVKEENK